MNTRVSKQPSAGWMHSLWSWRNGALALVPLLAAAGFAAPLMREEPAASPPPLPSVTVATPLVREVDQWDQFVGRFAPSQSVQVRPRVGGAVTAIHFRDGQMVSEGQRLFTVDQRPYLTALAEARAEVASVKSAIALARSDYQRALQLQQKAAISASEVDALRTRVLASEAALSAAQARAQARALDVEFTEVRAPIAGRISDRRIDVGNLVAGGQGTDATLLTTINALDPIYFSFEASEALYLKARRQQAQSERTIEIRLQDETSYRWRGRLDFTDNGIDPRSGTIRGRAVVANPDLVLMPGLFGSMRMASSHGRALLIPDAAIQTDQASKIVFVVSPDDVVGIRTVRLGPVVDGLRVIASGLALDDRVIIGGVSLTAPGAKVQARNGTVNALPQSARADSTPPPEAEATLGSS